MKLIMFSKMVKEKSLPELAELAGRLGLEGYDLCVRPGYPVSPDNAATELVKAVRLLGERGLAIPMVTGNFDLLETTHPTAAPLLEAMGQAGVGLLKLGYFGFDPAKQDYWQEVGRIRRALEAGGQTRGEGLLPHPLAPLHGTQRRDDGSSAQGF
jgi:sugar phosphate isomerase/epimerase